MPNTSSKPIQFIDPMKAKLVKHPSPGNWLYEIKFDGYRALAFKNGKDVRLFSRNRKHLGDRFPEIVEAVSKLKCKEAVLDGEVVALDENGRSSFHSLQAADSSPTRPNIHYYVFDLLRLNGKNVMDLSLVERKPLLKKVVGSGSGLVRFSASLEGNVEFLLQKAEELKLEGLIGKKADSVYQVGERSGAWIKLKLNREQEFVIGGYTEPARGRLKFGAVLVGYYEGKSLQFCAAVGTGFDDKLLRSLYERFQKIAQKDCPFSNLPEKKKGRFGDGITAAEMKRCHWVKPVLVCRVKFTEWTPDGKLRHSVFLSLREDKEAKEVVRDG